MNITRGTGTAYLPVLLALALLCTGTASGLTCDAPPAGQTLTLQTGACNQSPAQVPCTESFLFPAQPSPAGDPVTQYYLDFGDGTAPYFGFNDFASHTYDYPGTYTVTYMAGTGCDRWIGANTSFTVATPPNYTTVLHGCPVVQPEASFSGLPLSGTAPLTVQFTSSSTGADDFSWDFGDGTFSPAQNPRHTYLTPGLFTVSLIARDICTGTESTATMSHFITVTVPSGTLAVTTVPEGAGVFIDNAFRGVTPLTLSDTPSGYHILLITLEGYTDYSTGTTVEPGQTVLVHAVLQKSAENETPTGTPAPTTAPAAVNGSIAITSIPSGAAVTFDGTYEGTTPVIVPDVLPGNHDIELTYAGYAPFRQSISVGSGQTTAVNANLVEAAETEPDTGSLTVNTDPAGARVSVDGAVKGVTPATIPGLSPGPHTLFLSLDGYYDFSTTVNITAGDMQNYTTGLRKAFRPSALEMGLAGLVILIVIGTGVYRLLRRDEI